MQIRTHIESLLSEMRNNPIVVGDIKVSGVLDEAECLVRPDIGAGELSHDNLILRVGAGERAALKEFYRVRGGKILAIVRLLVENQAIADEVLVDVFVRIWRDASTFEHSSQTLSAWLFGKVRACVLERGPIMPELCSTLKRVP